MTAERSRSGGPAPAKRTGKVRSRGVSFVQTVATRASREEHNKIRCVRWPASSSKARSIDVRGGPESRALRLTTKEAL